MKLVYFSILKEKIGKEEDVNFEGDEAKLKDYLCNKYKDLCDIIRFCRFAKDNEYQKEFKNEDTVLVIPPVSGG